MLGTISFDLWFHQRLADKVTPKGWTVSKRETLPAGEFGITEYIWGQTALWFLDMDNFTDAQRQKAYEVFTLEGLEVKWPCTPTMGMSPVEKA